MHHFTGKRQEKKLPQGAHPNVQVCSPDSPRQCHLSHTTSALKSGHTSALQKCEECTILIQDYNAYQQCHFNLEGGCSVLLCVHSLGHGHEEADTVIVSRLGKGFLVAVAQAWTHLNYTSHSSFSCMHLYCALCAQYIGSQSELRLCCLNILLTHHSAAMIVTTPS